MEIEDRTDATDAWPPPIAPPPPPQPSSIARAVKRRHRLARVAERLALLLDFEGARRQARNVPRTNKASDTDKFCHDYIGQKLCRAKQRCCQTTCPDLPSRGGRPRGNVENRLGGFSPFSGLLQGVKAGAMPKQQRLLLRAGGVRRGRPGSEVPSTRASFLQRTPLLSYESNPRLRLPCKSIVTGIGKMLPHRIMDAFKTAPKRESLPPL